MQRIHPNNKKTRQRAPGDSVHSAGHLFRPLGRISSKLDFFLPGIRNQPHLLESRQARSVSRLSPESGLHRHRVSIAKSKIPSSRIQDSFTLVLAGHCEFQRSCGNRFNFAARPIRKSYFILMNSIETCSASGSAHGTIQAYASSRNAIGCFH